MTFGDELAGLTGAELAEFFGGLSPNERRAAVDLIEREAPWEDPLDGVHWSEWHQRVFPEMFTKPYGDHHAEAWDWVDSVGAARPRPLVLFWPRGHGKSATTEVAVAKLGATRRRRYFLYVSATQDQADDHVAVIAAICESKGMEAYYPEMAAQALSKFGQSKGWRRNRLWAANGFVVDAMGLDTAKRGARSITQRPDGIVFDDIDDVNHGVRVVKRNLRTISQSVLPTTRGTNAAIMVAQNFTHPGAIAVKMHAGETDILSKRHQIGPLPAIKGLRAEVGPDGTWRIEEGEPTWEGMDLAECEDAIDTDGWLSFQAESQQDVLEVPGSLLKHADFDAARISSLELKSTVGEFDQIIVSVDPNKTGRGDDAGVQVLGRFEVNGTRHSVTLRDLSDLVTPSTWRDTAAKAYLDFGATAYVVEASGVGELAERVIRDSPYMKDHPMTFHQPPTRQSKGDRARPVAQLVKDGRHHHLGVLSYCESQWTGWDPDKDKSFSPGSVDAEVHGVTHLLITPKAGLRMRDL